MYRYAFSAGLLAVMALLSGCARDQSPVSGSAGSEKSISMAVYHYTKEAPRPDDAIWKEIERQTQTRLDITWIPDTPEHEAKVHAMIASGDLPMVIVIKDVKSPAIVNSIRSGLFWELGPYLKDYPNLTRWNNDVLKSVMVDGKLYTLYRTRPLVGDGVVYRKDWLRALGLREPRTLEQLYEVIRAFTRDDPDGNGLHDTIGMVEDSSLRSFRYALAIHGAPNEWMLEDGCLKPAHMTEPYLDTLKFYKRLFDEKLINEDFPIASRISRNEAMSQGRAGMYFSDPDHVVRHPDLFKLYPQAELDTFVRLAGAKGERVLMERGYTGMFIIPKTKVKTEGQLREILSFFNRLSDADMQDLFVWGIEGLHYSLKEGKPFRERDHVERYTEEVTPYRQFFMIPDGSAARAGYEDKLMQRHQEVKKDMERNTVPNPAAHLISETYSSKGKELNTIIYNGQIRFILGKTDEAGWSRVLEEWRKQGGDRVIEELNAALRQENGGGAGR